MASRALPLLHLALAFTATAAPAATAEAEAWPGLETAVDEERLLDLESSGAIAGDDTSLLQVKVELPAGRGRAGAASGGGARLPVGAADIPEASRAWALFQEVPEGPARPDLLRNVSALEPPGDMFPNESAVMQRKLGEEGAITYVAPQHPGPNSPDWLWVCFGRDYDINKYSSWSSIYVATPQLVPFVVPADHPNRSDVSVVLAPGGGGSLLAWEGEGTDVAKWLNKLGISAFVLKYRVPQDVAWGKTASVLDAQRAVSLVRRMAPALGLNASRVGLFGASHGGFVALFTAFAAGRQYPRRDSVDDLSPRPDFLLLLYPEVHSSTFERRSLSQLPTESLEGVSLTDLSDPPPIFIASGANDKCCKVDSMYSLHQALKRRGDPVVEIDIYSGVKHGFSMCYRSEKGGWEAMKHEACLWMLRARRFIMWYVEQEVPDDVRPWYEETVKYDSFLVVRNTSGRGTDA